MEGNMFNRIFNSYFRVLRYKRIDKNRNPLFIDLSNDIWKNLDNDSEIKIFEPELLAVRGATDMVVSTKRSFGNEYFKGFIERSDECINIIIKIESKLKAESVMLSSGTKIISIKDIDSKEITFSLKEAGDYSVTFINKAHKNVQRCDFIIKK